jgi:hypothetical protein
VTGPPAAFDGSRAGPGGRPGIARRPAASNSRWAEAARAATEVTQAMIMVTVAHGGRVASHRFP